MPHLVQGHLRFTEDDFINSDFKQKIKASALYRQNSIETVAIIMQKECERLRINLGEKLNEIPGEDLIMQSLVPLLAELTALTFKFGLNLEDLMKRALP
jgi:hypothetical protein